MGGSSERQEAEAGTGRRDSHDCELWALWVGDDSRRKLTHGLTRRRSERPRKWWGVAIACGHSSGVRTEASNTSASTPTDGIK